MKHREPQHKGMGIVGIDQYEYLAWYLYDKEDDGTVGRCRLRLESCDCEHWTLEPDERVRVRLPGAAESTMTFRGLLQFPPYAWAEFDQQLAEELHLPIMRDIKLHRPSEEHEEATQDSFEFASC